MASPKPPPRLNPRSGNSPGQRPTVQRPGSSLWYGLAFLLVLGFAQLYFMTPPGRSIPYSEFKALVKDGQVADVTITEQIVRGTLKQPAGGDPKESKPFTSTRVDDPTLIEDLERKGVR